MPDVAGVPDPHVVATLLKLFLRELPQPLVPFALYGHFLEASKLKSPREQVVALQPLVVAMPPEHRNTLQVMLKFLRDASTHSAKNKMPVPNLAAVFGPTILRGAQVSAADAGNSENVIAITCTLIRFWDACYGMTSAQAVPDADGVEGGGAPTSTASAGGAAPTNNAAAMTSSHGAPIAAAATAAASAPPHDDTAPSSSAPAEPVCVCVCVCVYD